MFCTQTRIVSSLYQSSQEVVKPEQLKEEEWPKKGARKGGSEAASLGWMCHWKELSLPNHVQCLPSCLYWKEIYGCNSLQFL